MQPLLRAVLSPKVARPFNEKFDDFIEKPM